MCLPSRHHFQKLYLIDSCNVLAGNAEFASPNKVELCSPTILLKLIRLSALNASALINKSPGPPESHEACPFLKGVGMTRMRLVKRRSSCANPGPCPVLRVTPDGRSFATVSRLSSNPVVMLNGASEVSANLAPRVKSSGTLNLPEKLNRCR